MNLSQRYQAASLKVLNEFPAWKREAIKEDLANKASTGLLDDYVEKVCQLAEGNDPIFTTLPSNSQN